MHLFLGLSTAQTEPAPPTLLPNHVTLASLPTKFRSLQGWNEGVLNGEITGADAGPERDVLAAAAAIRPDIPRPLRLGHCWYPWLGVERGIMPAGSVARMQITCRLFCVTEIICLPNSERFLVKYAFLSLFFAASENAQMCASSALV